MADSGQSPPVPTPDDPVVSIFKWNEIVSWSWVGWYVALLVGLWGALMGTRDYDVANVFFVLSGALFCFKWGHITQIHRRTGRLIPFLIGTLVAISLVGMVLHWTSSKIEEAAKQKQQLSKLDLAGCGKTLSRVRMALTNTHKSLILRWGKSRFRPFPAIQNPFSATC